MEGISVESFDPYETLLFPLFTFQNNVWSHFLPLPLIVIGPLFQEMKYMPPQPHVHNNGHPGLPHNPWVGIHGGGIPGDPWGSMHYGLHAQELKQEIKPLPSEYGRAGVHHPAMHHPTAWQPPVTGAYLGMGTNSGTNSPSPVHALQHPAYGMNGKNCLLVRARVSTAGSGSLTDHITPG